MARTHEIKRQGEGEEQNKPSYGSGRFIILHNRTDGRWALPYKVVED